MFIQKFVAIKAFHEKSHKFCFEFIYDRYFSFIKYGTR